jgi:hypothetical protein
VTEWQAEGWHDDRPATAASPKAEVLEYRDMLVIIRDRIKDMVAKGMTLEQVRAAKPTLDYDPRFGADSGFWTTAQFVEAVYQDVSKAK